MSGRKSSGITLFKPMMTVKITGLTFPDIGLPDRAETPEDSCNPIIFPGVPSIAAVQGMLERWATSSGETLKIKEEELEGIQVYRTCSTTDDNSGDFISVYWTFE